MHGNFSIPYIAINYRSIKIKGGDFKDKIAYPRQALFSTLMYLKPTHCLEIGTYYGGSAMIFFDYMKQANVDGLIVTCDVQRYTDLEASPRVADYWTRQFVKQIIVYSHLPIKELRKHHSIHNAIQKDYPTNLKYQEAKYSKNSINDNVEIIKKAYNKKFDFAHVDGDHTEKSFLSDIEICKRLLKPPKYILLDDIKEGVHECAETFKKIRKDYNCYEFENWGVFAGRALIWEKT